MIPEQDIKDFTLGAIKFRDILNLNIPQDRKWFTL
jgi:hypothetical protein